jgi:hypothetical protein
VGILTRIFGGDTPKAPPQPRQPVEKSTEPTDSALRFAKRHPWQTDGNDGGHRHGVGLGIVRASGERALYWDEDVLAAGLQRVSLAGPSHYSQQALAAAKPGQIVALRAEPDNPYDANAVAVVGPAGQIGHLPRNDAARLCSQLEGLTAVVFEQYLQTTTGPIVGVRLLIGPTPVLRHMLERLAEHGKRRKKSSA